jgi:hypothetical protein
VRAVGLWPELTRDLLDRASSTVRTRTHDAPESREGRLMASSFVTDRAIGEESVVELRVYDAETDTFVRRTYQDSRRAFRLLEGGLLVEAHRTLAALHVAAEKRARQRGIDPE